MICPVCEEKTTVCDISRDPIRNEVYRKHRCTRCDYIIYTKESEIEFNEVERIRWNRFHRKNKK